MTFLGDEGRDVLVVKRMIVDHKFTLLGPITSVGSIYMGPIYYYFMVPFLWAWKLDPVGPAVMVAIVAILTVGLIFITGAKFFHTAVGLIASLLYATSPLTIAYGRSSWNPNIVPFFSILAIYSLLEVVVNKKFKWLIIIGFSLGILLQLHYVTLILIPVVISCLALIRFRIPIKIYFYFILSWILSYSPFLLFELRHQFVNSQSVLRFITEQNSTSKFDLFAIFNSLSDLLVRLFWRLVIVKNAEFAKLFIASLIIFLFFYTPKIKKNQKLYIALKILIIWLTIGILSFSLYRGVVYDYYFGSLFVLPFLLTGIFFYNIWNSNNLGKIFSLLCLIFIILIHFENSPLAIEPNNMLNNTKEISTFVYNKTEGKPYNFALLAPRNSDHAYRYFLEIWGHPPITIANEVVDPNRNTVTDQLLIVCEEKVCQPLGHPLWEIAGFGRAEIIGQWDVVTTKVFHLNHYKET